MLLTTNKSEPDHLAEPIVRGVEVDSCSGCAHYRSALDIVAIKFACCAHYYACFYCHQAEAGHDPQIWPRNRFDELAVFMRRLRCRIDYLAIP